MVWLLYRTSAGMTAFVVDRIGGMTTDHKAFRVIDQRGCEKAAAVVGAAVSKTDGESYSPYFFIKWRNDR
jgi:hypothetical protein